MKTTNKRKPEMRNKTKILSFMMAGLLLATPAYAMGKQPLDKFSPVEKIEMKLPYALTRAIDPKQRQQSGNVVLNKDQFSITGVNLQKKNGVLTLTPSVPTPRQRAVFGYSWSTSGIGYIKSGNLRFSIPKHVIKSSDGKYQDDVTTSFITRERADQLRARGELPSDTKLVIDKEDKNWIYVSNYADIPAASSGYFEVSYDNRLPTYEYRNHEKFPLKIKTEVWNEGKLLDSYDLGTEFQYDLKAKIESIRIWQPELKNTNPSGKEDSYVYLTYALTNLIAPTNPTSYYDLTYTGNVTAEGDVKNKLDAEIYSWYFLGSKIDPTSRDKLSGGKLYGSVVVRVPKDQWYANRHVTVRLHMNNKLNAYDIPESQAQDTHEFYWTHPTFEIPFGHFNTFKYGNVERPQVFGQYSRYDLERLQEGKVKELENIEFDLHSVGYPLPWTVVGDPNKPENYGKKPVTYSQTDKDVYLVDPKDNKTSVKLGKGDYRIDSISLDFQFKNLKKVNGKAVIDERTQTFIEEDSSGNDQTVNLYINGVKKTTTLGALKKSENYRDGRLYLDGCQDLRIEFTNASSYTFFDLDPRFTLIGSKKVLDFVKGKEYVLLRNNTNLTVTQDGKKIVSIDKVADDRIRRTLREGRLSKSLVSTSNDAEKRTVMANWKIQADETFTTGKDQEENVLQHGGTFYDLLPYRNYYVNGSAIVYADGKLIDDFEVNTYYQGERQVVKIHTDVPANKYKVIISSSISWDDVTKAHGVNYVVYKTGNEDIGFGSQSPRPLDLPQEKKNVFLSTSERIDFDLLANAISGLTKTVKADNDNVETTVTKVSSKENYAYSLRYRNSNETESKNNVFYDNIEGYKGLSEWFGTLKNIDLVQLKVAGVDPKAYVSYSYADLSSKDSAEKAKWIPVEEADLSKAKAIKVDCSKRPDGSDFVLGRKKNLSVRLIMQAPKAVKTDRGCLHTYNNVYISNDVIDSKGKSTPFFIHQDFTDVSYCTTGRIVIDKISPDKKPIPGMEFTLQGVSSYGNKIFLQATSNATGKVIFDNVEVGKYQVSESRTNDDWLQNTNVYDVSVDEDGNASHITVTNSPRIHSDLVFSKVDSKMKNNVVSDTTFILSGTSDYGNKIVIEATSDKGGIVRFNNIEKGRYSLSETNPNKNYILNREPMTVVVDENGNVNLIGKNVTSDNGKFSVSNVEKSNVFFYKVSSFDGKILPGAEFSLSGVTDEGEGVEMTSVSTSSGRVEFSGLEPGTYYITEKKAPEGYLKNGEVIIARVDEDGSFSLLDRKKDLSIGGQKVYKVTNDKVSDKHIYVKKIWDASPVKIDDLNISLSTSKDAVKPKEGTSVMFESNAGYGKFSNGTFKNEVKVDSSGGIISGKPEDVGKYIEFSPVEDYPELGVNKMRVMPKEQVMNLFKKNKFVEGKPYRFRAHVTNDVVDLEEFSFSADSMDLYEREGGSYKKVKYDKKKTRIYGNIEHVVFKSEKSPVGIDESPRVVAFVKKTKPPFIDEDRPGKAPSGLDTYTAENTVYIYTGGKPARVGKRWSMFPSFIFESLSFSLRSVDFGDTWFCGYDEDYMNGGADFSYFLPDGNVPIKPFNVVGYIGKITMVGNPEGSRHRTDRDFSFVTKLPLHLVDCSSMFAYCDFGDTSFLKNLDVSDVTNMDKMFYSTSGFENASILDSWNVSKVKSMENMFDERSTKIFPSWYKR